MTNAIPKVFLDYFKTTWQALLVAKHEKETTRQSENMMSDFKKWNFLFWFFLLKGIYRLFMSIILIILWEIKT